MQEIMDELVSKGVSEHAMERIRYAMELDQTLSMLESKHHNYDPEKLIMDTLIYAVTFYDGDWAGVMEADLAMKMWSTRWWYNRRTSGMTPNGFDELEEADFLHRWIRALTYCEPMIITDVEAVKDEAPVEYAFLKANRVKTLVAVPFWRRPTGFLIVRNPKRYLTDVSILRMLAFVAVSSINEKRLMDSIRMQPTPDIIEKDTDVVINLLDELQIITSKGVLAGKNVKATKMSRLVAYMVLHEGRPKSVYDIARDLDEDVNQADKNVKGLVYRLHQKFNQISDHRLIVSDGKKYYRLNPELNVITDLKLFERCISEAKSSADPEIRGKLLKRAVDMYKTGPLPELGGEHWFTPTIAHYGAIFIGLVNQLLKHLDEAKAYVTISEYATQAIKVIPENPDMHYWLVHALNRLGLTEIAKSQLTAAKKILIEEDYEDLLARIDREN